MKRRDIFLVIGALSFILFVVLLSLLLSDKFNSQSCGCPKVVERNFVYIFIVLSAIFIGSFVYYLTSLKIDNQKEIISKNISLVLNFLDNNEREILNQIIENNGEILQSDLTKKFGKLKSHRMIKKLESQRVIEVKNEGKTNKIYLKPELKRELVK
jgi:uncharacterized membrane protein